MIFPSRMKAMVSIIKIKDKTKIFADYKSTCADDYDYASLVVLGKHRAPVSGHLGKSQVW